MTALAESRLALEPTVLALRAVGGWLSAATDRLGPELGTPLFSRAELAVHEACMNVIDHGGLAAGDTIDLELLLDAESLLVRVSDRGDAFDPAAARIPERLDAQERGYGLTIIRSLASDLAYRRAGTTNTLELRFCYREKP